jgi:16S rRNA (uracil1498-N3)-methyltransferase
MNRFYTNHIVEKLSGLEAVINDSQDIKHIIRVLRLTLGDSIEICDGKGLEYIGTLKEIHSDSLVVSLTPPVDIQRELPCTVSLFQGITKGQKWDYLIQKSVEAGVLNIIPVAMQRSVSKVSEEKADKKTDRWQKIAEEAAKQAKRSIIPTFHVPLSFKEALAAMKEYDLVIIAYENELNCHLSSLAESVKRAKKIAVWVGPEGGIDPKEIEALMVYGSTITLGRRILRTETAPVVLLAQLSYILETGC